MRVYYKTETGEITFTATLAPGSRAPAGDFIEVPDQELDLFVMRVQDGALVTRADVSEAQRDQAITRIGQIRSDSRLLFVTAIPGQSAIYIAKNEEAVHLLSSHGPEDEIPLSDYPLIASEVGVTAPTAWEVAQVFANLNLLWRQAAGAIDGQCFLAENRVRAAATPEEVALAISNLEAQIAAFLGGS